MPIVKTRYEDHLGITHHFHSSSDIVFRPDGFSVEETLSGIGIVYRCIGVNDDQAIQTIITNFFNNGTAMSLNLTITGTMGLRAATDTNSGSYSCILISPTSNTRNAVVNLYFVDFSIPQMPVATGNRIFGFLLISGDSIVNIHNLSGEFYAIVGAMNSKESSVAIMVYGGTQLGGTLGYTRVTLINCYIHFGTVVAQDNCELIVSSGNRLSCPGGSNPALYVYGNSNIIIGDGNRIVGSYSHAISVQTDYTGLFYIGASTIIASGTGSSGGYPSGVGLRVYTANSTASFVLSGTRIKTTHTDTANIITSSALNATKWNITGCSFSNNMVSLGAGQFTNGYPTPTANIYMPPFANRFEVTNIV